MEENRVLIIVPAYNEAGNIEKTIREIQSLDLPLTVVVINDASTDQTASKAKTLGVAVITLPYNLGIGGAVQTGYKYALKHSFDIAVQVDGDGQHDVSYLSQLIEPIRDGRYSVSIGSRFIEPFTGYRSSFVRRIGITFFARLISFLTRTHVTDPTSGFRACDKRAIALYAESYPQDFPEPEAIVIAKRLGLDIVEVPVEMRERVAGVSSIRYLNTLHYMIKVTFAILLDKLKRKDKTI